MSLETSIFTPVSHESCVRVELPRQPFLLGPAPFVVQDETAGLARGRMEDDSEAGVIPLPVPHRYSA